ncbi:MAG: SAP domain-containing protein [Gammaproteobacteria bacterium]|nr:SAP domain-containing protein [Gammaproteobacteria bacterium]MBU1731518.1 SAP domain-containing protein [Gammaproteobacteria bacterium]MBU1893022.1 SAP domain-containing protein [Gammaproteobacteria bacterium]
MNLQDIRAIARDLKLKPSGTSKAELVRQIQRREGNFDCYATASLGVCDQSACLWRKDCFTAARQ